MDWITGMQKVLDYIEDNITEELDYNDISKISLSSNYHFQRVFSILCGYTLGEYIRNRRLTLAGAELTTEKAKVLDVALKYGYDSPDSFSKAFVRFHGITPSAAREPGATLRSFARLHIKVSMEGGITMNYRIQEKAAINFVGYKQHFIGAPSDRYNQQHDFMVKGETRFIRYALQGLANDCDTEYCVITNVTNDGYDYLVGNVIPEFYTRNLEQHIGQKYAEMLAIEKIPKQTYVVVETEKSATSILRHLDLRRRIVSEWLPTSGYCFADAPEITILHMLEKHPDSSYVELLLPIEKI